MMNNAHETIRALILAGEFLETRHLYPQLSLQELEELLVSIAGGEDNYLTAYAYTCFLIIEHEKVAYHEIARSVLNRLAHLQGAYQASLYHVRRALELEPGSVRLLGYLLFLNQLPDKVVSDEEALAVAQEILRKEPKHQEALATINRLEK